MINRIISMVWIGFGIFWFIKPLSLQKRFAKKGRKRIGKVLFLLALLAGGYFISIAFSIKGLLLKILFSAVGIIAIWRAFVFLKGKAIERLIDWLGKLPLYAFRVYAVIFIAIGVILFVLTLNP